jgi:FkbM family methyltransferase
MNIPSPIKAIPRSILKTLFPLSYWRHRFRSLSEICHEAELRLVPYLCDPQRTSVDVGADGGVFSIHMCRSSQDVIAFEPRPPQAKELSEMFAHLELPVHIEQVALSCRAGTAQMRMLIQDLGRSTIETANSLADLDGSARAAITVAVKKLDDYALTNVAFIKIDVEGHEVAVLEGAQATITSNLPVLLVESEDRHRTNAVSDVNAFMQKLGYSGYFLLDDNVHEMHEFDLATHQDSRNIGSWKSGWKRTGVYINNFFFLPKGRDAELTAALRGWRNESTVRQGLRAQRPHNHRY